MPDIEKIQGKSEGRPASKRILRGITTAKEEMVELELAPLMNFFMILVPFLSVMAVFVNLAVVDFSLPPGVSDESMAGDGSESNELDLSIVITKNGYTIMGSGQKLPQVEKIDGKYDFPGLIRQLKAVKYKYPQQESIVLMIESDVLYEDIIHFMDKCRESQYPNIGLSGGFQ